MSLQNTLDILWAECGISYFGFSQNDFEEEYYYWTSSSYAAKDKKLPNKIKVVDETEYIKTLETYPELLHFLCRSKYWNVTTPPLELFDGLNSAKKMVFVPPNKESDKSGKIPKFNQRNYSKRLKKLDAETKRSIMDQIKIQGLNLDMLIGSSKKDIKAKMDWATKIAPLDSALVIEFKCGESTASYKFNTIISLIDFLVATDCTNF